MIKPLNNHVLLKISSNNKNIKLDGGKVLYLDTSFQKEKHSDVVCEVMQVPDRLYFELSDEQHPKTGDFLKMDGSMDWDCDMELKVGDEVIVHYMAYVIAFGDNKKAFIEDGVEYFLCPYDMIYLAKRRWTKTEENAFWAMYGNLGVSNDVVKRVCEQNNMVTDGDKVYNVIMLNSYVLVQPVERQLKSSLIDLPDNIFKGKSNKKMVRVCFAGKINRSYASSVYSDQAVYPGQLVIVDKSIDVPLEAEGHRTFNGDQEYWRLQACLIYGLVK
jgi:hypothetical protein